MPNQPEIQPVNHLATICVTSAESGLKLLSFLEKRLESTVPPVPQGQLHRWVRTGQVRVNKKRAKPFMRLQEGDSVRVPPFARMREVTETSSVFPSLFTDDGEPKILWRSDAGAALTVVGHTSTILALHKPAGLAAQPGSGLTESVSQVLADIFAGCPYTPAPAHRLDRHTSGLLLAGLTHAAQEQLCGWFSQKDSLVKEYLTWVQGAWPLDTAPQAGIELCDHIRKEAGPDGKERMVVVHAEDRSTGKKPTHTVLAQCLVRPLRHAPYSATGSGKKNTATLLLVRLVTGRTHQIRVQLASRGFPIIGDRRYNGPPYPQLLLNACRITLPDNTLFETMPAWPKPFAVAQNLTTEQET